MEISEPMVKEYLNRSHTSEDMFSLLPTTITLQTTKIEMSIL